MSNIKINIKEIALKTIEIEAAAISNLKASIDQDFIDVVELIFQSKGRVVVTGIGKSAIIANKIVATFNSTGTPSLFMHAADAIHGDLGMIQKEDIILMLSKSGESPEIKVLIPILKNTGNKIVAIVGNADSALAKNADYTINASVTEEACPNNLAPTASTTAQLAMGDALAICLLELKGFSQKDFAKFHPGGSLGKKLYLTAEDIYANNECPKVLSDAKISSVIIEITSKRLGATAVTDQSGKLMGMITDGDIRRMLQKNNSLEKLKAKDIMSANPKTIDKNELAVSALEMMRQNKITQLIVTDKSKYVGMIHIQDIIREGIV